MKLRYFILRRLFTLVPVLLGVSVVMFFITHVVPSSPARLIGGPHATEETIRQIESELGLDKPLYLQYGIYIRKVLSGDFGISIHSRNPVIEDLKNYFPATFELTSLAMLITLIIGIPLGVFSATHKDRAADHATRLFSLSGVAMPVFWLGLLLQLLLSSYFKLLPVGGRIDPLVTLLNPIRHMTGLYLIDTLVTGNWPVFKSAVLHLILPTTTLVYFLLATLTRMSRSSMLEILRQDYIRNAMADGLPEKKIFYRYALRNALIPTVTIAGLTYGLLLGGDFLVEIIYSWPGLGFYAVGSMASLDFPAIMGVTMLVAVIFVTVNLIVDILYAVLDPRIRYR
jgi:peptide/nickel transport system permease protein